MKKYFIAAAFVALSSPAFAQSGIVPGSAAPNPGVAINACSQMGLSGTELSNCQASQAAGTGSPSVTSGAAPLRPSSISPQNTQVAPGNVYDSNSANPLPATVVPGTGYAAPTLNGGTTPAGTGYKAPTAGGTPSSPSGTGYSAPSID